MLQLLFSLVLLASVVSGASFHPKGLAPRLSGRIVGGVQTTIDKYPHQVSLRFYGSHRCGGSVYKVDTIITAAHCTADINPKNLQIAAGTSYQTKKDGVLIQVKSTLEHEEFNGWTYFNDVAIVFLETGLEFGRNIQPIALASAGEKLKPGTMVHVSGWGSLQPGGYSPEELQVVYVSVVGNEECAKKYEKYNEITDSMMCAGEPQGGKDACQGDSGGPLITNNKLYGIVSWGVSCAEADFPGVYADVGNMRNWIDFKLRIQPFQQG